MQRSQHAPIPCPQYPTPIIMQTISNKQTHTQDKLLLGLFVPIMDILVCWMFTVFAVFAVWLHVLYLYLFIYILIGF